jgi:hypothetical protein
MQDRSNRRANLQIFSNNAIHHIDPAAMPTLLIAMVTITSSNWWSCRDSRIESSYFARTTASRPMCGASNKALKLLASKHSAVSLGSRVQLLPSDEST